MWEVGTVSRYDDMIKIKATNVWPQTVDEAVFSFEEIDEYNGRVFIAEGGLEVAKVDVEFKNNTLNDETKATIITKLSRKIKEATQVTMKVEEVPQGTLQRFEYKARRWTDERIEGLERVKYLEK
jgi:phenylacetate-CoA ligase